MIWLPECRRVAQKRKCSNPECKNVFSVTFKYYLSCGAENDKFDAEELLLTGPGKKPGCVNGILTKFSLICLRFSRHWVYGYEYEQFH